MVQKREKQVVEVKVKSRKVTVTGKFGKLFRSFKDIQVDVRLEKGKKSLIIDMWLASNKMRAHVKRIASMIKNMINGVRRRYKFLMKAVYAHYPITMQVSPTGNSLSIRNFLGCVIPLTNRWSGTIYN